MELTYTWKSIYEERRTEKKYPIVRSYLEVLLIDAIATCEVKHDQYVNMSNKFLNIKYMIGNYR